MMDEKIREIAAIARSGESTQQICQKLSNYHENDIADALVEMDKTTRIKLYKILGLERVSEIFTYIDDVSEYLSELSLEQAADILENMDADDAVDALEDIENSEQKEELISLMDESASDAVRLINSYDKEEVGSFMTTNFIQISNRFTVKEAMKAVISQAKENDNISTIYVVNTDNTYYGALDLRDLIIAREYTELNTIISTNYPVLHDTQAISDVIEQLKDYAEDSFPVLDENRQILGIITAQDIVEAVEGELGDDYAKLAGLTAQEDLNEKLFDSMKKRLPWLILLLFLGLFVSSVVGIFESIVAQIAIVMCFQSLILDMAGNVGTQSLAVTIRVLMAEDVGGREKLRFIFKEMQIGGSNGLLLGSLAFVFVGGYLHLAKGYAWLTGFRISGCVGFALFLAMIVSSLVGTLIPIFFHKIKVDPAVASGPLITTVNDLVAVVTYYGLAGLFLAGRL